MLRKTKIQLVIGILAVLGMALAIRFVLSGEKALVVQPKGHPAQSELKLMSTNIWLMLTVVLPTFFFLLYTIWKHGFKSSKAKYDPEHSHGAFGEVLLWIIPSIVIAVMTVITWYATHELDPYKPLESDVKPLTIQVVALDWKWLFIYPEQGIAAVNFVQFPERTPIHFELAADNSPMNSFWIPELSGQIYSMTGMVTQLHVMAHEKGIYAGRAAEINGEGYADMTFTAVSGDFENWVEQVKRSPQQLTAPVYQELTQPSINHPIALYSSVENNLFHQIVMKYMHPEHK